MGKDNTSDAFEAIRKYDELINEATIVEYNGIKYIMRDLIVMLDLLPAEDILASISRQQLDETSIKAIQVYLRNRLLKVHE